MKFNKALTIFDVFGGGKCLTLLLKIYVTTHHTNNRALRIHTTHAFFDYKVELYKQKQLI